jgi:hypothetical protein
MAWIESHQDLLHHPKTQKLARILCVSRVTAIGHLHCLWWWAVDYAEDGELSQFDALDIAIGGEWEGEPQEFLDALIFVGFVDCYEDSRWIHNWDKYFGRLLEQRQANARRQREWRERHKDETQTSETRNGDITVMERSRTGATVPNLTVPNLTVPNHTEPKNGSLSFATANAAKAKRATPLSDDFIVTDEMTNWAFAEQFTYQEIEQQTALFRDHFKANGKPMKDWPATWRNWLRRSRTYAHTPKTANGFGPKGPDAEWFAKQARDLERQGL